MAFITVSQKFQGLRERVVVGGIVDVCDYYFMWRKGANRIIVGEGGKCVLFAYGLREGW